MPAKNTIKVLIGGKIITLSGYDSEAPAECGFLYES